MDNHFLRKNINKNGKMKLKNVTGVVCYNGNLGVHVLAHRPFNC